MRVLSYVDDFLICYRAKNMNNIERQLQLCLNKIEKWAMENGFKFSSPKTLGMHFCNKRGLHPDPELKLYNSPIKIVSETKFLGLLFDNKLTFLPHIKMLKNKSLKALNILKFVSSTDWGADSTVLLNLYRSLIRSKLDYGCIVYGSARPSYIKLLDTVHHQGLRLSLGAFRTSPVESLYVEANEPSLENRRIKLGMQYATKLKAYPSNPAHDCVFNPLYENVYDKQPNTIQPFGLRVNTHFENSDINLDDIARIVIPENPPWLNPKPTFNFELAQHKQSEINPLLIQQHFAEIRSVTSEYSAIYTDGSKDSDRVASAAVFGQQVYSARILSASSIFSAEANAILLALKFVASSEKSKFMICSDSLSCLLAIESCKTQNPFILKIVEIYKSLFAIGKHVIFTWIPRHIGIHGNTVVDREAKNALDDPVSNCSIPYTDIKPFIVKYILKRWQDSWDQQIHNKLHEMHSLVGKTPCSYGQNRKEQVVLTRCRIGHSRFTHSYLLNNEERPEYIPCNANFSLKHVLIDCVDVADVRQTFYNANSFPNLFTNVAGDTILQFLKENDLYTKI